MPLEVDGILYIAGGNQAWAVDARTGRQIWHFARPGVVPTRRQQGLCHVARPSVPRRRSTPRLLCLDAQDGKLIWQIQIGDPALKAFGGMAPLVIRDHIIVGTSGDTADLPGFLESIDPDDRQSRMALGLPCPSRTIPSPGTPGRTTPTWSTRGGGMTWITGTYDPQLNLLYWGTGNPHPVENGDTRIGANLYTCTIVALNPDTGKLVWYFQSSPHDTHDWDTVMTPVLFDGTFEGKPRKMLAQAE